MAEHIDNFERSGNADVCNVDRSPRLHLDVPFSRGDLHPSRSRNSAELTGDSQLEPLSSAGHTSSSRSASLPDLDIPFYRTVYQLNAENKSEVEMRLQHDEQQEPNVRNRRHVAKAMLKGLQDMWHQMQEDRIQQGESPASELGR